MTWEHKGIIIRIDGGGAFHAEHDDVKWETNTLSEMRMLIEKDLSHIKKRTLNLKVVGILTPAHSREADGMKVGAAVLIGVNRSSREYIFEGVPPNHDFGDSGDEYGVLPDTPANRKLLEEAIVMKQRLFALGKSIAKVEVQPRKGYGRISTSAYEDTLKDLEKRYAKALAASGK